MTETGWSLLPEAFLDLLNHPEPPKWQESALCAQSDPEAWFPEKGGSVKEAKRICGLCPVREECLQFALDNNERFGVYGGLSERERRKLQTQPDYRAGREGGWVQRPRVDRDAEIIRLSAEGASAAEVAEQVGVAQRTVVRARSRHAATVQQQTAA